VDGHDEDKSVVGRTAYEVVSLSSVAVRGMWAARSCKADQSRGSRRLRPNLALAADRKHGDNGSYGGKPGFMTSRCVPRRDVFYHVVIINQLFSNLLNDAISSFNTRIAKFLKNKKNHYTRSSTG